MPRNEPEELDFETIYKVEQQGERQLDLVLKGVDPLKDTDFYTFVSQLQREQFARKWPSWVFNREEECPDDDELQDLVTRSEHDRRRGTQGGHGYPECLPPPLSPM